MQSKNPSSADNQQERSKEFLRGYITGLVDGEGSFHIAFGKRDELPLGISIIPEFHLSQNQESKKVLEITQRFLGCGYIKANHRLSNDKTYVLVVRDKIDLATKVVPFFEFNQLVTEKKKDFQIFAQIVRMVSLGQHKELKYVRKIIDLAYQMNGGGKRRIRSKQELFKLLKSSTTICQSPDLAR